MQKPPAGWPIPRSAYIHVPFCSHRCGYCNFTVLAGRDDLQEAYLTALGRELQQLGDPQPVDTLYLGGGTPTELTTRSLSECIELCRRWFPLAPGGEFSIEANPEDITPQLLTRLKTLGVTRISLGVQSFQPGKLTKLQRHHTPNQARQAIEWSATYLGNVSIDLIFAAPGETLADWQLDLQAVVQLPVSHVSAYGLTYEKGAAFYGRLKKGFLSEIDENCQLNMYRDTIQQLSSAGLVQYEVSNFAKFDNYSRHNFAYWEGLGWWGAGPGAARFVNGRREVNHRSTTHYIRLLGADQSPTAESDTLNPWQWALDRTAFGLRTRRGVDLIAIGRDAGVSLDESLRPVVDNWYSLGLAERDCIAAGAWLRLTQSGMEISDSLLWQILSHNRS